MDKKEIANIHVIIEHQIIGTTFALLQGTKIQNTYNIMKMFRRVTTPSDMKQVREKVKR